MFISRSRNSHIRVPRSVTIVAIGWPLRTLNAAMDFLERRVTGQKPVTRRSKKSIAAFKVRKGQPIATMVTLRGTRMWEFLDRLMNIALPRVRDFKGVSAKGFDGRGNYTL